jgi:hypothetical protein
MVPRGPVALTTPLTRFSIVLSDVSAARLAPASPTNATAVAAAAAASMLLVSRGSSTSSNAAAAAPTAASMTDTNGVGVVRGPFDTLAAAAVLGMALGADETSRSLFSVRKQV